MLLWENSSLPGKKYMGLHPITEKSQDAPECSFFSSWRVVKHVSCSLLLCRSPNIRSLRQEAALAHTADRISRWCCVSPDWDRESLPHTQVSSEHERMGGDHHVSQLCGAVFLFGSAFLVSSLWSLQSGDGGGRVPLNKSLSFITYLGSGSGFIYVTGFLCDSNKNMYVKI